MKWVELLGTWNRSQGSGHSALWWDDTNNVIRDGWKEGKLCCRGRNCQSWWIKLMFRSAGLRLNLHVDWFMPSPQKKWNQMFEVFCGTGRTDYLILRRCILFFIREKQEIQYVIPVYVWISVQGHKCEYNFVILELTSCSVISLQQPKRTK